MGWHPWRGPLGEGIRPHAVLQTHESQVGAVKIMDGVVEAHGARKIGTGYCQLLIEEQADILKNLQNASRKNRGHADLPLDRHLQMPDSP